MGGVTPSGSLLECAEVGEAQRQITLGHSPASYLSQNSKLPELQHRHLMLPWELILKQMIFLVPGFFSPTRNSPPYQHAGEGGKEHSPWNPHALVREALKGSS